MNTVTSPDGTTIAYDQSGEGPPLILVGGTFNDRQTTAPLAAALAPHFTAVSYDRRGRGDSTDTAPYAVEREVEDLGSVVGALGGSAFVFGHSSGAALALAAAASGFASAGSSGWLQRGAKTVADTVPGAQHRILDGGFHEIPPELLAPALQAFFTS
jgi:Alpha/beta hydrolase family